MVIFFRTPLKLFSLIFILLNFGGCTNEELPWELNFEYSRYLTISSAEYEEMTGKKSADTVELLRIYKTTETKIHWPALQDLLAQELIFETREKTFIHNFMLASQQVVENSPKCKRGLERYYVVLFDNKSKRVGYFLILTCNSEYREVLIPDEKGFGPISYYNTALKTYMDEILKLPNKP